MEEIQLATPTVDLRLVCAGRAHGPPVLLVPGLAAGPMPFVVHPSRSLAETLERHGLQPWTVEFEFAWRRGGPGVSCLVSALDAALEALCGRCAVQRSEAQAIGHSLGGLLLLALQVGRRPLGGLVTLATAARFQTRSAPVWAKGLGACAPLVGRVRPVLRGGVPTRTLARLVSAHPSLEATGLFTGLQFHPATTEPAHRQAVLRHGVRDLPLRLVADLAELYAPKGLRLETGECLASALEGLDRPLLLVAARQDMQCPLAAVHDTHERARGSTLLELGVPVPGAPEEGWGHLDLLTGSRAPEAVFEPVAAFVARGAAARAVGVSA